MTVVRRALAAALLALFSFSLIPLAAFAPDPEAGLPSCCRRNGKHGCQMTTPQEGSSSGSTLQASRCPYFPVASPATAGPSAEMIATSSVPDVAMPASVAGLPANESSYPVLFRYARHERGPPVFLLS